MDPDYAQKVYQEGTEIRQLKCRIASDEDRAARLRSRIYALREQIKKLDASQDSHLDDTLSALKDQHLQAFTLLQERKREVDELKAALFKLQMGSS